MHRLSDVNRSSGQRPVFCTVGCFHEERTLPIIQQNCVHAQAVEIWVGHFEIVFCNALEIIKTFFIESMIAPFCDGITIALSTHSHIFELPHS